MNTLVTMINITLIDMNTISLVNMNTISKHEQHQLRINRPLDVNSYLTVWPNTYYSMN